MVGQLEKRGMESQGATRWYPALFWSQSADKQRCELCPRYCQLQAGDRGFCGVRRATEQGMETASYGRSVMMHADPVEKKPLYHFKPGKKALTVAIPGCNLGCLYCQNHRISQVKGPALQSQGAQRDGLWPEAELSAEALVEMAAQGDGLLALSYSEPILSSEWVMALGEVAKKAGVSMIWKSNGYITPEAIEAVAPYLSAINIDFKALGEGQYRRLTGVEPEPIWHAIEAFYGHGVWLEISLPVVDGFGASAAEYSAFFSRVAQLDPRIPIHLIRVNPHYKLSKINPTHPDTLLEIRRLAWAGGLKFVYVERALGPEGRTTHCDGCGKVLISRGIWTLEHLDIRGGRCDDCGRDLNIVQ